MKGRLRAALLLSLIPGIVGVGLSWVPYFENLERAALDILFESRGAGDRPLPLVCVVGIDDASYDELGVPKGLPWPRGLHAALVRTLAAEGARAVAFDVLFDVPRDPEQDEDFRSALAETGIVVLGSTVEYVGDPRFRSVQVIEPVPELAAAAAAVAEVTLPTDRDGVIRSGWLTHGDRPSLALAAYKVATGDGAYDGERGARLIDYYGPPRTVPTASVWQALSPAEALPPGFFKDRIVFVGKSQTLAAGETDKDAWLTPFRGKDGVSTFGVEIHATIAGNLLDGSRLSLLPRWLEALLLLGLPLSASLLFMALGPWRGGAAFLAGQVAPWASGYAAFSAASLWVPIVIPFAVQIPAAYGLSLLWYYRTTVRDREKIRKAFSFYLSPAMVSKVAETPEALNLGGEEIVATAMFTDIKGFTAIAEGRSAPETAALLNAYFSEVNARIFETEGTLIKFIGDAVFAIWNAPLPQADHAARACRTAIALSRLDGPAHLVTRIGVHTGPMLVGNLGSAQRFDYTAIGDAVNLSSRLEGLNKAFGTTVLVSGPALEAAGPGFLVRPLGRARVVGRSEPVAVYELLGLEGESLRIGPAERAGFEEAVAAFAGGRFEAAERGFRRVLEAVPGDGPSTFYLGRCRERLAAPAPDADGVLTFAEK